ALRERLEHAPQVELALGEVGEVELDSHEEPSALLVARMLVRMDQVRARLREETGDRGNDPRAVGARDRQASDVLPGAVHRAPDVTDVRFNIRCRSRVWRNWQTRRV